LGAFAESRVLTTMAFIMRCVALVAACAVMGAHGQGNLNLFNAINDSPMGSTSGLNGIGALSSSPGVMDSFAAGPMGSPLPSSEFQSLTPLGGPVANTPMDTGLGGLDAGLGASAGLGNTPLGGTGGLGGTGSGLDLLGGLGSSGGLGGSMFDQPSPLPAQTQQRNPLQMMMPYLFMNGGLDGGFMQMYMLMNLLGGGGMGGGMGMNPLTMLMLGNNM